MNYPLRFVVSYVQPITQHYESRTVRKAPLQAYLGTFYLTNTAPSSGAGFRAMFFIGHAHSFVVSTIQYDSTV